MSGRLLIPPHFVCSALGKPFLMINMAKMRIIIQITGYTLADLIITVRVNYYPGVAISIVMSA